MVLTLTAAYHSWFSTDKSCSVSQTSVYFGIGKGSEVQRHIGRGSLPMCAGTLAALQYKNVWLYEQKGETKFKYKWYNSRAKTKGSGYVKSDNRRSYRSVYRYGWRAWLSNEWELLVSEPIRESKLCCRLLDVPQTWILTLPSIKNLPFHLWNSLITKIWSSID